MLEIKNLQAHIGEKQILKGINLSVKTGEVHAIMGPNGSGKSTLASVLAGREGYDITDGEVMLQGNDILDLSPEERAREGVFLAFQYPVEIPGVTNINFIKTALESKREFNGLDPLKPGDFLKLIKEKAKVLGIPEDRLKRQLNVGFSGGEKKRNEALQLMMLNPSLAILDETDSGLDVDAFKIVADAVNSTRSKENSMLIITHYQRLLERICPDFVHVFVNGSITVSYTHLTLPTKA